MFFIRGSEEEHVNTNNNSFRNKKKGKRAKQKNLFFVRLVAMKTFILLSAIPGSGKSTWAKQYKATHENTYIVASDEIRVSLWGRPNDFHDEPKVWETFNNLIHEYGKEENVTVIADATNLQNKLREKYFRATPEFDKHILVLIKVPYEVSNTQNKMRCPDRIVPEHAMERLKSEYEDPSREVIELYDEYIEIHDFMSKKAQKPL